MDRLEQLEHDRRGVTVSHRDGVDFGVVNLARSEQGIVMPLEIAASVTGISLVRVGTYQPISSDQKTPFTTSVQSLSSPILPIGGRVHVDVRFQYKLRGSFSGRLELTFRDRTSTFVITRRLRIVVGNPADHELLKPSAPYVKRKKVPWQKDASVVEGERPPAMSYATKWKRKLPMVPVPPELSAILSTGDPTTVVDAVRAQYLPDIFHSGSYGQHFHILLWVEEARLIEDLKMYDMEGVRLAKQGRLYSLPVPGLAEKRPSVVIGDSILAQVPGAGDRDLTYRGFVHEVARDSIRVGFHPKFNGSAQYNIRFQFNRTPTRRQHQAVLADSTSTQRLLFPVLGNEGVSKPIDISQHTISLFNIMIASNTAQLQAVKTIMNLRPAAAPFKLWGPPGTGKTVVAVESMLQVLRQYPSMKILACAPSNSAADLIAQRLSSSLSPQQMFRCNAVFRPLTTLPKGLEPYVRVHDNHFVLPTLAELNAYRVIVSTCGNASFAYNIGMATGHFAYIFIDEAGQASEPEIMTAVKGITGPETRVVLSGDPKQLGPVIRSSVARELGLGKSYMERLMDLPVYSAPAARGRSVIKLVKNYRSHSTILRYPNEQFYGGELEACAAPAEVDAFLGSPQLVAPHFPVVFQHVPGENEREATSPSYFNILEATEVVERVQRLLADHAHPIRPEDIGVITPYYAQARKIRLLLKQAGVDGTTVCSVELMQGQERRVIILSTVRSSRDLLSYDARFTLGFVANPRRFNVAVTRAKALLIVIGDSSVLSIDPLWRGFLNYVFLHGGWSGDVPSWNPHAPVDTTVDYAAQMREAAVAEMDALVARLAEGEDTEGAANIDVPFVEAE